MEENATCRCSVQHHPGSAIAQCDRIGRLKGTCCAKRMPKQAQNLHGPSEFAGLPTAMRVIQREWEQGQDFESFLL